jgi:hypothetical protein
VVDVVSRPVRPLPSWVLDGVFAGLRGHMLVIAYRETERLELEDLADALAISRYEHVYLLSVGADDAAQAAQDLQTASGLTVFTNKSPPQGLVIDPDSEDDDQERLQLRFLDPGRTFWAPSGAAADEELFATPEQFFTGAGVRFP